MSKIGPGDLVMAVDEPPEGYGHVIFEDGVRPGMTGVALTHAALVGASAFPFESVLVRWPHVTYESYTFALRRIDGPPPLAELTPTELEVA